MTIKIELEFIPVSERLPEEWGPYLCLMSYGHIETYQFSLKHNAFNTYDHQTPVEANNSAIRTMTHWAKPPDLSAKKEQRSEWVVRECTEEEARRGLPFPLFPKDNNKAMEHQRRRDMFERVALLIANNLGYHADNSKRLFDVASNLTTDILKEADRFARGE